MSTLPDGVKTQAFINGEFVGSSDGSTFTTYNPATGEALADVASCNEQDVDLAVSAARAAFESGVWSRMAPADRKRIMLRFADLLEENLETIAQLDSLEVGKPITDCRELDTPDGINTIRWYGEAIDKVFGKISTTEHSNVGIIVREPIGVVGVVTPWNFPSATLSWKIGPALASGNSIVVKPAEVASLGTIKFAELAYEAGIPAGVFNVVPGSGRVVGQAIGLHPDIDAVTFTGSTETGKRFLRYSADSNLKEVSVECGGKCPQIVMADCATDLELVAEDLTGAAFWNTGQNCTAGSRILVHSSLAERFTELLVARVEELVVGSPSDPATTMGSMVDAEAAATTLKYVEDAVAAGAKIATGGTALLTEVSGAFVAPTVLTNVTPDMAVAQEEIFGPVVAILTFDDVDEAVALANDSQYGLAATIWSHDINVALDTAARVHAGTVAINGYSEGDITTPFGGFRQSGFGGREKGIEAFDQYTELKTIWITLR